MGQFALAAAIAWIVKIFVWVVIIDVVLTFIPSIDRRSPFVKLIRGITEPLYRPIRKIIPTVRLGDVGLDLSPIIVILGVQLIGYFLISLLTRA